MPPITEAAIRSVTIQKEVMSANAAVVSCFLAINTNATVSQKIGSHMADEQKRISFV